MPRPEGRAAGDHWEVHEDEIRVLENAVHLAVAAFAVSLGNKDAKLFAYQLAEMAVDTLRTFSAGVRRVCIEGVRHLRAPSVCIACARGACASQEHIARVHRVHHVRVHADPNAEVNVRQHGTAFKLSDVETKKNGKLLTLKGGQLEMTTLNKDHTSTTESRGPVEWAGEVPQDCHMMHVVGVFERLGGTCKCAHAHACTHAGLRMRASSHHACVCIAGSSTTMRMANATGTRKEPCRIRDW